MPSIGPMELVVVLVIALIVLGPKKLPEVGRSVGKGMREFKDSLTGESREEELDREAGAEDEGRLLGRLRVDSAGMRISAGLLQQVVEHAERDAPNECCGVIAVRDDVAVGVHPAENLAASPLRFEVDGIELHRLLTEIEDRGEDLGVIYHSHTRSEPYPSQTDLNFAAHWPGVEWLIVGLAGGRRADRAQLPDRRRAR